MESFRQFALATSYPPNPFRKVDDTTPCGPRSTDPACEVSVPGLLASGNPTGTMVNKVHIPVGRAAIALGQGDGTAAVEASIVIIVIKALAFFGGVALVSAYLLPTNVRGWAAKIPFINRFGARDLLTTAEALHFSRPLIVGFAALRCIDEALNHGIKSLP